MEIKVQISVSSEVGQPEVIQQVAHLGVPQFAQRLRFDLAYALACQTQQSGNLLQAVDATVAQSKA